MRARAPVVGAVAVLLLVVAAPAAAKVMIAEAHIRGPGFGGAGLRILGPGTSGMWESGLDVAGGLDDVRADSVAQLGFAAAELGPKYLVTYRFDAGRRTAAEIVRQELYPYAEGGPVTNTPTGQRVAEGQPWGGEVTAGWYRSPATFFEYLVDHGLPETNPVTEPAGGESGPDTLSAAQPTPWRWIAPAFAGLAALSLVALRLRRRMPRRSPEKPLRVRA